MNRYKYHCCKCKKKFLLHEPLNLFNWRTSICPECGGTLVSDSWLDLILGENDKELKNDNS